MTMRVNKGPRLQIIEAGNHIDNCGLLKLDHTPSALAWRRLDDQVLDVITRRASLSSAMRHKEDVGMRGVELGVLLLALIKREHNLGTPKKTRAPFERKS